MKFFLLFFSTSLLWSVPVMAASSTLDTMPLEDKVSLSLMIADYGDEALVLQEKAGTSLSEVTERVDRLVKESRIGGVLFKGRWTPAGLFERIRHLKEIAKGPLLFAQDLEWGLAMRHDGVVELPKALCVAAIRDDSKLHAWAEAIAATAAEVGINLILGPVGDVNSNPNNPVIHDRSFGDLPGPVARKVAIVVNAFQRRGLLACVKHYPGHGATSKDSHHTLPIVDQPEEEIGITSLSVFKAAIDADVACVMTAHIALPQTPSGPCPATLSSYWTTDVLRDRLKFTKVLITDDLIMEGVRGDKTCAETFVQAVRANNDLCIVSREIDACREALLAEVRSGKLSEAELNTHAQRVIDLQASSLQTPVQSSYTLPRLLNLQKDLYEQALTLCGKPFTFNPKTTLVVQIGSIPLCPFIRKLVKAHPETCLTTMRREVRQEEVEAALHFTQDKREILVVLAHLERLPSLSFGLNEDIIRALKALKATGCTIRYVVFGSPYVLRYLPKPISSALIAYESVSATQRAAFRAVTGAYTPTGELPIPRACH